MTIGEVLLRLGLALALGGLIGFERQWRQRMAGLRTNALVAIGAAGFVVFALKVFGATYGATIVAQIVSGIGFLGAGVILREGINVRGLNTAATLWCSAMVGAFAGGGELAVSTVAAAAVVLANLILRPLVRLINRQSFTETAEGEVHYTVELRCKGAEEAHMRSLLLHALSQAGLGLRRIDSEDVPETSRVAVRAEAVAPKRNDAALEQIVGRLSLEPHVSAATWQIERTAPEA